MLCIAICDDEEIFCSQLERELLNSAGQEKLNIEVFYSCEKLYEELQKGTYFDLIFLDIEFQFMNGVDMGKRIREELENERVQIVYVSGRESYAMELFEVRPMNFLIKPISPEAVRACVEKAGKLADTYDLYFEYKAGAAYFRIPYGEILYFESDNRKIRIHTRHGVNELYGKLDDTEQAAPAEFLRIHQSYLVNRMYITYWKAAEVILLNRESLPVSKGYRKRLGKALLK